jgi:dCMP deaminase
MYGTCTRKQVGACIFSSKGRELATAYNSSLPGLPTCIDGGCEVVHNHCIRTIHAEVRCIAQAALDGYATFDGTIYVTASPCWPCFKAIASAGIKRIVFDEQYGSFDLAAVAKTQGIELVRFKE